MADQKKMIEQMLFIREFEQRLSQLYQRNIFRCPIHLSVGHEASAVGVCFALQLEDKVFGHHRSHHHYLAKGGNPRKLLLEMLGSSKGCSAGFGGSTHLIDESVGFMGSAAIISGLLPIAAGFSHALKLRNDKNIVVTFCGDAAVEQGVFFEVLNMATLWNLPLMFVIEDNLFSCDTPREQRYGIQDLSALRAVYGIEFIDASGADVTAVYNSAAYLRREILRTGRPGILRVTVARAYEHCGPSRKEDVRWQQLDPLKNIETKWTEAVKNQVIDLFNSVLREEGLQ
jgi:TPP-dependent pyruvate/acetoin dehydrogenase alpha subunit